ncbi:MAG: integrase catalytic subunit, partial [Halanaerobium sp.]
HTDRGNEFKNKAIDDILDRFDIERSLSNKGCPYCYEPRNISVTRTWFSPVNE